MTTIKLLGEEGVEGVRIDALCSQLGVTKGSFYWHFKDRNELLKKVLLLWEERGTQVVIKRLNALDLEALDKIHKLWALASNDTHMAAEIAIRNWAQKDASVEKQVRRIDKTRLQFLGKLFEDFLPPNEAKARSLALYTLLIGQHFLQTKQATSNKKNFDDALAFITQRKE